MSQIVARVSKEAQAKMKERIREKFGVPLPVSVVFRSALESYLDFRFDEADQNK